MQRFKTLAVHAGQPIARAAGIRTNYDPRFRARRDTRTDGITPDLIRISLGIEDVADPIEDLDQAIDAATV